MKLEANVGDWVRTRRFRGVLTEKNHGAITKYEI